MKKILCCICTLFLICSLGACNNSLSNASDAMEAHLTESYRSESSSGTNSPSTENHVPYDGNYPQHETYGVGIGAMPGRVVWEYAPDSAEWDGSGYWWETEHFDETVILNMVNDSIASLGDKETAKDGWNALFTSNKESRNMNGGYTQGEKIAIKANINGSGLFDDDNSGETHMSYTNPVLLKALLTSLVKEGGVNPSDITVYDVSRIFPEYMVDLCTAGDLKGVHFVGRNNGIADENAPINWSYQFSGKVNYLPTCVTEATYVINLANLKGHSYGITLCGKNHFGSFINGNALRPPEGANLHQWLTKSEMGIYSPLVDLMANSDLGGKTVLYMLDAIICAPSEGASITEKNSKWQQATFNDDYTSSIFVSQDPVAIDSVGADFLNNEPTITENNSAAKDVTNENYLHEAGLVSNAPSGITYTDGNGHIVTNLGVHEHWNNSDEKLYSRNLGKNEGIELIQRITDAPQTILGDVNSDGEFNISDVTILQKWLIAVQNTQLVNWKAADLCEDDRLNVFDLCLMKRELLKQKVQT
ncbi:MAG: DUF362 domain-containing protein [Ruminococcus flavefaciens]|nr:DUF362 domain-containing protein [Ruminococcus flavefaciens]MCM1362883.1 DUF362 domain-containing protein [Clostridiales bacterium]